MIPISADQVLTAKDEESGIEYRFKPLLGDAEYAYYSAMEAYSRKTDHAPYLGMAEIEVKRAAPDKVWDKGELDAAVRAEAIKMAVADSERTADDIRDEAKAVDKLIDAVLIGWDAPLGVKVPEFKTPPSQMFRYKDKMQLLNLIITLNSNLTEAEEKN